MISVILESKTVITYLEEFLYLHSSLSRSLYLLFFFNGKYICKYMVPNGAFNLLMVNFSTKKKCK